MPVKKNKQNIRFPSPDLSQPNYVPMEDSNQYSRLMEISALSVCLHYRGCSVVCVNHSDKFFLLKLCLKSCILSFKTVPYVKFLT